MFAPLPLPLPREPYLGVRCPAPNSIACDRVGIAVWLDRPATGLQATIAGRTLPLRRPSSRAGYWEGTLSHAGLLTGALRVVPDCGPRCWQGRRPRPVRVRLRAKLANGALAEVTVRVLLHPGWG